MCGIRKGQAFCPAPCGCPAIWEEPMHYDTLLFDLDGTLLDFRQTEALSLAELFAAHGIPFTASLHRDYMENQRRAVGAV